MATFNSSDFLNGLTDFSNINVSDISSEPVKRKGDSNLYTINLQDAGKDGVYRAKLVFLPNPEDLKKSIVSKYTYWLTTLSGENGMYVDDPSTIGEKSPIADLYFKFKKSTNPIHQSYADQLKRSSKFYSLVLILDDPQHPEYNGQVKVFPYGIKIKNKIDAEINDKEYGCNPFDVFGTKDFRIEVKKVGGFPNYDSCVFVGNKHAIAINGKTITPGDSDTIVEFFNAAPSLKDYEFKKWTAEIEEEVSKRLATYTNGSSKTSIAVETARMQEPESVSDDEPIMEVNDSDSDDLLDGIEF